MSHVNNLLEEFSEQNLLLQMLLGVLSETERVEQLLPKPTARRVGRRAAPPTVDPFLAALLGIVSVREQLRGAVAAEAARRATPDQHRAEPGTANRTRASRRRPPTIRELMR